MNLEERINFLLEWANMLDPTNEDLKNIIQQTKFKNQWFTEKSQLKAINAIKFNFLDKDKLNQWLVKYEMNHLSNFDKSIGLVLAGNLPLVGFHDVLTTFICGYSSQIKLSAKDETLYKYLFKLANDIEPKTAQYFQITERIKGFDAVIATGSNNSSRYFDYYFGKYPNIIRRNRNSIAVLDGTETDKEIQRLGNDIFDYFGLGCRNVSKLLVPENYDFPALFSKLESFKDIGNHHKYKNNFEYNYSLILLNNTPHYASDFLVLTQSKNISSRISTLHYEFYKNEADWKSILKENEANIQCVVGKSEALLDFGTTQSPELWDYADNVDTVAFLLGL